MALTKDQKQEWEEKLKEGVYFLVDIEMRRERKGTLIPILKHFNGNLSGIPKLEKGFKKKGKFASRIFIDEFLKTQADLALEGAPTEVIDDIAFEGGHLHGWLKDFFVDVYFTINYKQIVEFTKNWKTVKAILQMGSNDDIVDIKNLGT